MKTYSVILQGSDATEENAREFALGFDFSETELEEYSGKDNSYVDTVNGVNIYYQYGADCYFFADAN